MFQFFVQLKMTSVRTSIFCKNGVLNNDTSTFKELEINLDPIVKLFSRTHIRNVEPTGFHNLPTNILLQIFKNLSEKELRKNIIPVCHKWKQVALLPELWNTIKFQGFHVPSSFICQQLRSFPNLKEIYLVKIDDVTTVVRQICRWNTQLEIFDMNFCRNDKVEVRISERVLRNLITSCKKLQKIDLKGTQFKGNLFYIEVALLPSLRSVDLSYNEFLTTRNIFQFVLNSQQLEELKLSYRSKNQYMSDNDAVFLFTNLKFSLKSITFDMMELSDVSFKALLECENLEKMYLYNALNISSQVLSNISNKLPNLVYLKIHHSQISTTEIIQLFEPDPTNLNKLLIIDLTDSLKLNSEALQILCNGCPNLEQAVFRCCKNLDNVDCLFENCKRLQVLDLAFCSKLSNISLIAASIELPMISTFYTDISRDDIFGEIKKNNPNIKIYICLSEFNENMRKIL